MKLTSLLGLSVAAALFLVAAPAMAAVSPAFDTVAPIQVVDDCLAITPTTEAKFFMDAAQGCDATVAELTGLCLVETSAAPPARIAIVFIPNADLSCTAIRPSPPG